ncbi:hypothetical protein LPJ75_006787 [Coemansia sp. RSA 2598]|nr:hypothetical protein LPJ75_006787 [Coemansia sp. RSA 2598]
MVAVVLTTIILYLRSIYRIAEFADGYKGKIYSAEWAFYVFDTLFIFIAFLVYIVLFIGPNFSNARASQGTVYGYPQKIESDEATATQQSLTRLV